MRSTAPVVQAASGEAGLDVCLSLRDWLGVTMLFVPPGAMDPASIVGANGT
jgi:hypothetical protein